MEKIRIIAPRGTGKTHQLLEAAFKESGTTTIVCSNPYAMEEKAKSYGYFGLNFMSYSCFMDYEVLPPGNYYIDELEQLASAKIPKDCFFKGYTLSSED